jgi:glycosyltransferase involved in cell wall biosynthesis
LIAIALLTLVPGVVGGTETYARELLKALPRVAECDYCVLLSPAAADASPGLPTVVAERYPRQRVYAMTKAFVDPRFTRLVEGASLVHYPLTVPIPRTKAPKIVTLHDVQHLDLPSMFSIAQRRYRALAYDRAAKSADRVIVISDFVRERAVATLGLDPKRVRVVPLGIDHATLTPGDSEREPFVYYPARRWPHKNHARLFEAFALVRQARPELRLVLTGGDSGAVPDGVDVRGHVPWAEVVRLMQTASALVFPSVYEGFGLPPLEAMACGCPVASSNAAALPEVTAGAARLFDPHDPRAIADALLDVLSMPDEWRARGLERAAQFSWDETARQTEKVYRELL